MCSVDDKFDDFEDLGEDNYEAEDGFDAFEAELLASYESEGYDYDLDDELADSEADEEAGLNAFEDYDYELDDAATCRNSRQVHAEGDI